MRRWISTTWAVAMMVTAHPALSSVLAQVLPSKMSVTVKAGEPVSRDVTITNQGDAPVVVHVHLSDWTLSESGDLELVPAGSTPVSLQGLISFEPSEFSLGPGESGVVRVRLMLPTDGPATRWSVLLSEVRPTAWPREYRGPRAVGELGTTIYLSRIRAERTRAEFAAMNVTPAADTSFSVAVHVRNPGERHFYSSGEIAVVDTTGRVVDSGRLGTGVVLPRSQRIFTWTCDSRLAPGRYLVKATLDTGEPELIVGETEVRWPLTGSAPPLAGLPSH